MATTNMQFGQSAINVVLNEGQLPAKLTTDASGNVTGLVDPVSGDTILTSKGEIALYGADDYVAGVAQETGITIASATIDNSALGTALTWSQVLLDTTGGGVWDAANPSRVVIPTGVTMAWFTGSVMFPPNANGARWVRLTKGATDTHMSNVLCPTAHAVASQTVQLSTGWINVVAGEYYQLRAIQDSASSLTLALGSTTNKGGSTFLRVAFK